MPRLVWMLLLVSCFLACVPSRLTEAAMIRRMESSKVHYVISDPAQLALPFEHYADTLWPQEACVAGIELDGKPHAIPARPSLSAEVVELLQQSEPLFAAQRYDEASKLYERMILLAPQNALPWLHWGDCAYFEGNFEQALARYRKAQELEPDNYQVYFYLGQVLAFMDRHAEAREAFITSLVLRPRNRMLGRVLQRAGPQLGVTLQEDLLQPRALASEKDGTVEIYADQDRPYWLTYGACKGFWLGEEAYRRRRLGVPGHPLSSTEELECLVQLVSRYRHELKEGRAQPDPELERLAQVWDEGLSAELFYYEIASRIEPDITLSLDDTGRRKLRDFISRFILVAAPSPRAVSPSAPRTSLKSR